MLKIKFFLSIRILVVFLFLCGCVNSAKENSGSEKKDGPLINNKQLEKSAGLFKETTFPFVADTALLFKIEKGDSLGAFEIKTLTVNCFKHDLISGLAYDLVAFYKIDSLKARGKYGEYCDSLDIGMTKVSTAHALSETQLDANTLLLFWGTNISSYEACPYSSAQSVYFTVVYKGDVRETFLLGENVSWGDAPATMQRNVNGKLLSDGTFTIDVTQINDEGMDLPEVEITKEEYIFAIKDGLIKLVRENRGPPCKESRKTSGF